MPAAIITFDHPPRADGATDRAPEGVADWLAAEGARAYALLDAALRPGLPEALEAEGAEHACLYAGDAAERLRDVAPYLVALTPDAPITAAVLGGPRVAAPMWGTRFGVLLRSPADLPTLRSHLRRFTTQPGDDGRTLLFRYWEPAAAAVILGRLADRPEDAGRWLRTADGAPVAFAVPSEDGGARVFGPARDLAPARGPFVLTDGDRAALAAPLDRSDRARLAAKLRGMDHFDGYEDAELRAGLDAAWARKARWRVTSPNGLAWLALLSVHAQRYPGLAGMLDRIDAGTGWSFDQIARMLQRKGGR